jgi:hypothetical protein
MVAELIRLNLNSLNLRLFVSDELPINVARALNQEHGTLPYSGVLKCLPHVCKRTAAQLLECHMENLRASPTEPLNVTVSSLFPRGRRIFIIKALSVATSVRAHGGHAEDGHQHPARSLVTACRHAFILGYHELPSLPPVQALRSADLNEFSLCTIVYNLNTMGLPSSSSFSNS